MEKELIVITIFSTDKVLLDEDSVAKLLEGDYPVRVKSKILATIREIISSSEQTNVLGFLPVFKKNITHEDATQDHYADLTLYLTPEIPCHIVSDLLSYYKDGSYTCREDIVRGSDIIIIGDFCENWTPIVSCLDNAGASSIKCVSIISK